MSQITPIGGAGNPPGNGGMEARLARLEENVAAIQADVHIIKMTGASKLDIAECKILIAECKTAVAETKASILMWVVGSIFLAQLIPEFIRFLKTV
jgi:hypothetical protein